MTILESLNPSQKHSKQKTPEFQKCRQFLLDSWNHEFQPSNFVDICYSNRRWSIANGDSSPNNIYSKFSRPKPTCRFGHKQGSSTSEDSKCPKIHIDPTTRPPPNWGWSSHFGDPHWCDSYSNSSKTLDCCSKTKYHSSTNELCRC